MISFSTIMNSYKFNSSNIQSKIATMLSNF